MSEELKACPCCGKPPSQPKKEGGSDERSGYNFRMTISCACGITISRKSSEDKSGWCNDKGQALASVVAAWNNRAQLPSQGGEEVAVAYIPVDRETGEHWHPVKYKGTGHICDYIPLYTHPADKVAGGDQHVRDSAELRGLCAARDEYRNLSIKYGDKLCELLKLLAEALPALQHISDTAQNLEDFTLAERVRSALRK